jgi:putative ABC transport system permease protein
MPPSPLALLVVASLLCGAPTGAQPSARSAVPPAGGPGSIAGARQLPRGIAIDERLAADAGLRVGDRVLLSARSGAAGAASAGDSAVVAAIIRRGADPAEVARAEYRVLLHLTHLQDIADYENRVDRFAVATRDPAANATALGRINDAAFGFRAHRSVDIAIETSRTFQVVSRFHRAIGIITIVASAVFLLCILLLKVEERRRDVAALRLMGVSRRSVVASIVLEAAMVALLGSALGTGVGSVASFVINRHYQGVYRTPLTFALVTPGIVAFAVVLSLALGVVVGFMAATRLARTPPLRLLGR